jgi:hypothetical protein
MASSFYILRSSNLIDLISKLHFSTGIALAAPASWEWEVTDHFHLSSRKPDSIPFSNIQTNPT